MKTNSIHRTITLLSMATVFAIVSVVKVWASVGSHEHPNLARGQVGAEMMDEQTWDSVNLFNGNLFLPLPLGIKYPLARDFSYQFAHSYNSNVWDLTQVSANVVVAWPNRYSNAGFGWDISFGRLIDPASSDNGDLVKWVYVSPDGASHPFYTTLHADVSETDDNVFYTRDDTYLRLKQLSGTSVVIEAPDGRVMTFDLSGAEWRLIKIADQFKANGVPTNYVSISYGTNGDWTITDNHGRTQRVYFRNDPAGYYPRVVDRIELSAFGGTTATYSFAYTVGTVSRPTVDNDPSTSTTVQVPMLYSITLPDSSKYVFGYYPLGAANDASGRMSSMQLPTLGKIEWTYRSYPFVSSGCPTSFPTMFRANTGVASRKLVDAAGVAAGTWTYASALNPLTNAGVCVDDGELVNILTTPLGDKEFHYFSVNTQGIARWLNRAEYGLPFSRYQADRPVTLPVNVASAANGATATASSVVNSNYPASAAINGDRKGANWGSGGGWNDATENNYPDWLQVNFAGSKTINEISLYTLQDGFANAVEPTLDLTFNTANNTGSGIRDFDVQYWNGTTWTTVPNGSVTGNNRVWRQFTFAPITTDKIRVVINKGAVWTSIPNNYSRIVEVEAYQPYTPSDARFISRKYLDCDATGNNCQTVRSEFVRYEQDGTIDPLSREVGNTNRREASQRVVYHDDVEGGVEKFAETDRSNFDGLGHYRQTNTNGNFGSSDVRQTFFNYDATASIYPSTGYITPSVTNPWVLNTFNQFKTTEGQFSNTIDYCFDRNTGFLNRLRRMKDPAGVKGSSDVVVVYTPDAAGQVVKRALFGGDVQAIGTGDLCTLAPGAEQYQIRYSYQYGSLSTAQFHDGADLPFGPKAIDSDIDQSTGLIRTSRDSAGLSTQFEYDSMGRTTWEKPQSGHGAWTKYDYTIASGTDLSTGAKTFTNTFPNGSTAGPLTYHASVLDAFGRVSWEQTRNPDGSYPNRYMVYNAMGWMTHRSEYSTTSPAYTQYSNFDPFGRYRTETPPDGPAHNIAYAYKGVRVVTQTPQVAVSYNKTTGQIYEEARPSDTVYDRQGRVWKENQHYKDYFGSWRMHTTVNSYNVLSQLLQATMDGERVGPLNSYDGRGFLSTALEGNETKFFLQIDALGNSNRTRRVDSVQGTSIELTNVYDRAGRLTTVRDPNNSAKLWKEFIYADVNATNDWRAGKLWKTKRYNDMSQFLNQVGVATVTETYTYGGVGGRVSLYETEMSDQLGRFEKFAQTFTYTELGDPLEVGYPNSVAGSSVTIGRDRKVLNGYTFGSLTSIAGTLNGQSEGWANSITYNPVLLPARVVHANGVTDVLAYDSSIAAHFSSVSTSGARNKYTNGPDDFNSGAFQYDGNDSVVRIGSQYFIQEQGELPPEPSRQFPYTTPCDSGYKDPLKMVYAATDDHCNARVFYYYTAGNRLYKIEDGVAGEKTWYFANLTGQPLTQYTTAHAHYQPWPSTWLYTRDYIYRDGTLFAVSEQSMGSSTTTTHYHAGNGVPGITTDKNGFRIEN